MNKAEQARLVAEATRKADPGLPYAFATIGLILGGCLIVALAVYGLVSATRLYAA